MTEEFIPIRNMGNGWWHIPGEPCEMNNEMILDWMLKTGKGVSFDKALEPCFCLYCMELVEQEGGE